MIYDRVVEYCKTKNIPLSEFEKKCKIGNGTVGKWKENRSSPTVKTLTKIAVYTGISIGYWLGGVL